MTSFAASNTVPVLEAYGPVWQGEGPFVGRYCGFLRLAFCNLHCTWCDTPYSWDESQWDVKSATSHWSSYEVERFLRRWPLTVLTGGEPLMHHQNAALVEGMAAGVVHVETNGTIAPSEEFDTHVAHYAVSPKLFAQGDAKKRRLKTQALEFFANAAVQGRCAFKVVVTSVDEVRAAAIFFESLQIPVSCGWIMPEGTNSEAVLDVARSIAPAIADCGLNLTLRQHVLMFGNQRSV